MQKKRVQYENTPTKFILSLIPFLQVALEHLGWENASTTDTLVNNMHFAQSCEVSTKKNKHTKFCAVFAVFLTLHEVIVNPRINQRLYLSIIQGNNKTMKLSDGFYGHIKV